MENPFKKPIIAVQEDALLAHLTLRRRECPLATLAVELSLQSEFCIVRMVQLTPRGIVLLLGNTKYR